MDRCPYIRGIRAGDEYMDYCELTERPSGRIQMCELLTSNKCETWEEIKSEDGYDEYLKAGVEPGLDKLNKGE